MSKAEEFIKNHTNNQANISIKISNEEIQSNCIPWVTPEDARKAVEIAREEMIKKACEYLDLHCDEVKTEDNGIAGWIDNEFIDNFRKAMKDE